MATDGMAKVFGSLMAAIETFGVNCPVCGAPLYRPKALSKVTGKKMAGTCMKGHYHQPWTETPANRKTQAELEHQARKNASIGFYTAHSVFGNDLIALKDFSNFRTETVGQQQLLYFGKSLVNRIKQGQVVHGVIMGTAGVGKTHIANGILMAVMKDTDYRVTTMFVDWQKLLSESKTAMHPGHEDVQAKLDDTMHQLSKAGVVVIDDLGAERGTEYDKNLAGEVFRIREDMTTIITTNMLGSELKAAYDERTMSRMAAHGQGNTIAVKGITDQRKGEH